MSQNRHTSTTAKKLLKGTMMLESPPPWHSMLDTDRSAMELM